jgi:serine/threonine-protein kinase
VDGDRRVSAEPSRCAATLPASACPAPSDPGRWTTAAGELLGQKFRVERVVGMGGMGFVVAAHHLALDMRVAIKLMRPELRARNELVRRFLREARVAARLTSPHVTRVLDVGQLPDGAPYIVMEYLDGIDLATWLRRHGAMPAMRAAAIVLQAGNAIAEAHAAGIIHRDLKPANLFVTHDDDGELVKVLDLGVCKHVDQGTPASASGSIDPTLGTPVYMAPEQMRSARHADARSDIWSLGVTLYELVTGRPPFSGETLAEVCVRVALDDCPPMTGAGVPAGFEAVVARCLAKQPSARFQTMTELAAALDPFASSERPRPARVRLAMVTRSPVRWMRPLPDVAVLALTGALLCAQWSRREAAPPVQPEAVRPTLPSPGLVIGGPASSEVTPPPAIAHSEVRRGAAAPRASGSPSNPVVRAHRARADLSPSPATLDPTSTPY